MHEKYYPLIADIKPLTWGRKNPIKQSRLEKILFVYTYQMVLLITQKTQISTTSVENDKSITIKYAMIKRKQNEKEEKDLTSKIEKLKIEIDQSTDFDKIEQMA